MGKSTKGRIIAFDQDDRELFLKNLPRKRKIEAKTRKLKLKGHEKQKKSEKRRLKMQKLRQFILKDDVAGGLNEANQENSLVKISSIKF